MIRFEYTMQHPESGDAKRATFTLNEIDSGVARVWRAAHEQQVYSGLTTVDASKVSLAASHETRMLTYDNTPPISASSDTVITLPCYFDQIVGELNGETYKITGLGWFTVCRQWANKKAQELQYQNIDDFLNSCGTVNENTIGWPHQAIEDKKLIDLGAGDMNKYS